MRVRADGKWVVATTMDDQDTVEKKSWCKLLIDGSILKHLSSPDKSRSSQLGAGKPRFEVCTAKLIRDNIHSHVNGFLDEVILHTDFRCQTPSMRQKESPITLRIASPGSWKGSWLCRAYPCRQGQEA